jgi:acetylglutamate kinase
MQVSSIKILLLNCKQNCNAIGLTGADGNVIQAHKRGSKAPSPLGEGLGVRWTMALLEM